LKGVIPDKEEYEERRKISENIVFSLLRETDF